jgi:transcriptional regulator with XRE-family HTH domain
MDLQSYRKSRGLTQRQVADELGVKSDSLISMIERGERPASIDLAVKIQAWSGGKVLAAELSPMAADLIRQLATAGAAE